MPPVWLAHRRMPHHSVHSGYDRIAGYLPDANRLPHLRVGPAWPLLDAVFRRWIGPRSGLAYYQTASLRDELGFYLHQLWRGAGIYHYLYGEDQFWLLGRLATRSECRLVATFHQPPGVLTETVTSTEHLRRLDAVVIVGSNQGAFFERILDPSLIHLVPHGVDVERFRPATRKSPGGGPRRCLAVGAWLRDFDTLHRVADQLHRLHGDAVEIVVVVGEEHHAYFAGCDNVRLLSGIGEDELVRLYQTCDLTILPLFDMTASNALLEAMACGAPLVASDVGAMRDYVDSSCATLVPAGDALAMTEAVTRLLDDPSRRVRMGEASRVGAERFDWHEVARRLSRVYAGLA